MLLGHAVVLAASAMRVYVGVACSRAHDAAARRARRYLVFLGLEAEHAGGQGVGAQTSEHEEPLSAHMLSTLHAVAMGNLSAFPDVRVKEIDSEVL